MATEERIRDGASDAPSLSGFECRCLMRRIGECHEAVQRAIVGAGSAQQRAPWICRVQDALEAAELEIQKAEQLAVAGDGMAAACCGHAMEAGS